MIRFHFFSFSSPTNLSTAKFNVFVPGFSLLKNFDAKNTTNSPLVNEYFVKIIRKRFKITFTPQTSSFAFVNAIELFILPSHLIPNSIARFTYNKSSVQGLSTYSGGLLSRALETKHRLNIGGETVTRDIDNLSRKWLPDDSYITNPQNAQNGSFGGDIKRTAHDESDGPNSTIYIGPDIVYRTAQESVNGSKGLNISWSVPVENNMDHFLRLYFYDIFSDRQSGLTFFNLFVYDSYVINVNNDSDQQSGLTFFNLFVYDSYVINVNNDPSLSQQMPYYYDFVVRSDGSGPLKVSVVPNTSVEVAKPNAFLNGLEVMKVIESSGLVPLDYSNSNSKKISLPVAVGSVLGGLIILSVMVVSPPEELFF